MGLVMGLFNGGIDWLPAIVGSIFTGVGVFSLLKGISGGVGNVANNEVENNTGQSNVAVNPAVGLPMEGGGDGGIADDGTGSFTSMQSDVVNPATGLPMIGGIGGVDSMGNPYGFDDD